MIDNKEILVLYYSRDGAVEAMAQEITLGIESVHNIKARVRTVPDLGELLKNNNINNKNNNFVTPEDFKETIGLALGSATRFGNMSASLKYIIDQLGGVWMSGKTVGKIAGVFTSTGSMHGGQETTLISMMVPLFHLGYILMGVPYSESGLSETTKGGTPYGPTHVASPDGKFIPLTPIEKTLCVNFGKRLATTAQLLTQ